MNKLHTVIRAEVLGYCMGVKMAVEAVRRALEQSPHRPVYTYGPLIHNAAALESLKALGVEILKPFPQSGEAANSSESGASSDFSPMPESFDGRSVVIRAHGIPPLELKALKERGAHIVDATCPRVLSSQRLAAKFAARGVAVILAGDARHAEIAGIAGFAPDCTVLESYNDAERFVSSSNLPEQAALIGQTTIRQSEYDTIAKILAERIPRLTVCPTICPATEERQAALARLASAADGILVIGGKNSANTKRLFAAARSLTPHAWLVENASELPDELSSIKCVGLAAGASTPDEIIDAVEEKLLASESP